MYEVLTKLKQLEGTPVGKNLFVLVKFRNDFDGLIDVHIKGMHSYIIVEHRGNGYKAFCEDGSWLHCNDVEKVYSWALQKLAVLYGSQQLP